MRGRNRKHTEVSVGTIVINQNTRADAQMQCLEVVYNCRGSYALYFTQICLGSNHRRDLMAAIGATSPCLLYQVVLSTVQNVSSRLSMVFGQQDMKHIRQHCKHNIVDTFTHSLLCICYTATYRYKNPLCRLLIHIVSLTRSVTSKSTQQLANYYTNTLQQGGLLKPTAAPIWLCNIGMDVDMSVGTRAKADKEDLWQAVQ